MKHNIDYYIIRQVQRNKENLPLKGRLIINELLCDIIEHELLSDFIKETDDISDAIFSPIFDFDIDNILSNSKEAHGLLKENDVYTNLCSILLNLIFIEQFLYHLAPEYKTIRSEFFNNENVKKFIEQGKTDV